MEGIMLPVGVVIPTKNSMKYLPEHLANLSTWIDLAKQVVVVDSFSTDGTVEFLKKHLRHPSVCFTDHPPGLFASWNHGIRQLATEFCYISTVGDSVTRTGLEHLVSSAKRLQCDLLVSHPNFVDETGRAVPGPEWPMSDIIRRLEPHEPVRLPPVIVMAAALTHSGGAITGSCASNIFRTDILQRHPFPLEFGTAGDGAWSLQNAGRVIWAATPEKVTTFRCHPPTGPAAEVQAGEAAKHKKFSQMARNIAFEWLESGPDVASAEARKKIRRLIQQSGKYDEFRQRHHLQRQGRWPWILNPAAWLARRRRNLKKSELLRLVRDIYKPMFSGLASQPDNHQNHQSWAR